jgi:hypothetical protein
MFKEMEQMLENMGELPSSLHIRSEADGSHYDYLIEKYGEDYYKKEIQK